MTGQIIVGVDGSAPAAAAVDWAADDAARRGKALRLVHVCEQWAAHFAEGVGYCEGAVEAVADRARQRAPGTEVSTAILAGNVIEMLNARSHDAGVDSIVVGSRGLGGFTGLVVGSVGLGVAGHASGPVVVVRETPADAHREVVVGFDGSPYSELAMDYAIEQARARGARLHVVYAWQAPLSSPYAGAYGGLLVPAPGDEAETARERLTPWREKFPDVEMRETARCEHPVSALADASRTADLVVVGSRGLGGFASAVLGSVSHGVLHHAHCPVAVVRPREETR
ncbi:universal stress protein [Nonomuraea sp. NBC_01738]|uniref:universal stress protein n=1 Tax=Nonomuraea sp. NBC_01738 TaxID=2976003 RepID=UPI002E116B94|nr:universal stress protein [Nonomuraea sp. NBC_01738]